MSQKIASGCNNMPNIVQYQKNLMHPLCLHHWPLLYKHNWRDRACFWHEHFLPPIAHCVTRKFRYLQKQGYFPLEFCPKLWTISPQQVNHVDNKAHQWSRFLTTLTIMAYLNDQCYTHTAR